MNIQKYGVHYTFRNCRKWQLGNVLTGKASNPVLSLDVFILEEVIYINNVIKKPIEGFERYYATVTGFIYDSKFNRNVSMWVDNVGYYQCVLMTYDDSGNKKRNYKRVHRLIAEAFIPNPDNLPQVNHKDLNKLNNIILNLEWATNSDNTQHGYDNDAYQFHSRSHAVRVFSKIDGKLIGIYPSIRCLSKELKLNRKTVTAILKGIKTTNNYDYEFEYVEKNQETIESVA